MYTPSLPLSTTTTSTRGSLVLRLRLWMKRVLPTPPPVLRLERDAWSMVKRLRRATNEYAPIPPPPRQQPVASPCAYESLTSVPLSGQIQPVPNASLTQKHPRSPLVVPVPSWSLSRWTPRAKYHHQNRISHVNSCARQLFFSPQPAGTPVPDPRRYSRRFFSQGKSAK